MNSIESRAELRKNMVAMLADLWRRVDWTTMRSGYQTKYDVFANRLAYAQYESNLDDAIEVVSHQLGLSGLARKDNARNFMRAFEYCQSVEADAIQMLEKNPQMLAIQVYNLIESERNDDPNQTSIVDTSLEGQP